MNNILNGTALLSTFALAAACGVSSPEPISLPVATFSEGATPILYDPAAGTLTLNGVVVNSPRATETLANGDASVFRSGAPLTYSAIAQNGDAFAISTATQAGTNRRGQAYGRRGITELPTTGDATFSGDYAGIHVRDAQGALTQSGNAMVDGDVMLAVDLDNSTLTGEITNRLSYSTSGVAQPAPAAFADVQITGGTIAVDGTFAATVTGGERTFSGGDYTFNSGSVNGVFAGPTGNVAAGVVTIGTTHPTAAQTYSELGSFVASQD